MKIITKNKSAYLDYDIENTYEAGVVLVGHEVKSIKSGHVNIKDAIVFLEARELTIQNMDIPLYEKTSITLIGGAYESKKKRTLLVTKTERTKIAAKTTKTGLTIIPLQLYIASNGKIKLTIGIGKLRRKIEKKQIIKERDVERQMQREVASFR